MASNLPDLPGVYKMARVRPAKSGRYLITSRLKVASFQGTFAKVVRKQECVWTLARRRAFRHGERTKLGCWDGELGRISDPS